ncbi:PRD domain-containing protein [Pseudalkalibacillus hwajinpoensis]|uniref:PRD domain-containing protein n=1 Tax=Guptibacillus hwajinpoensis TaxID=208199 RepID=UPI00325BD649
MTTIKERLEILKAGDVISADASVIAEKAVQRLTRQAGSTLPQNKVEMLVTHLATALTRISRGEIIDSPPDQLVVEVEKSDQINEAVKEITWVQSMWNEKIPESELSFLKIHYVSIFQEMK